MVLAKDKRELHDDNARLHQQLASLGKDVGEPRRYAARDWIGIDAFWIAEWIVILRS